LVFHAYIHEMYGSRSKIPSKKFRPYIYDVKFLALLGAPYIYDISRLRVKSLFCFINNYQTETYRSNKHVIFAISNGMLAHDVAPSCPRIKCVSVRTTEQRPVSHVIYTA
jgi:hypothetical protein